MADKEDLLKGLADAIKAKKDVDPGFTPKKQFKELGKDEGMLPKDKADFFQNQRANPNNMKTGGKVSSASSRADGIAQRGKTRGKMC